jgi:hypothetical protein
VTALSAGGRSTQLGKTPLELSERELPDLYKETVQIQVSKDGFGPQEALVPKIPTGARGDLTFTLATTQLPPACQAQSDVINEIARGVAEGSSLIQRKRFTEAGTLLRGLTAKFNGVAVLYDLLGTNSYLQKDLNSALDAFKRSNQISPNNPQTLRMIERIRQMQGGSGTGG